jgi:demethylmenaquinone methyltransferase/2-methoxy-6-polyprenyl-1,4-benzoquinol methylase
MFRNLGCAEFVGLGAHQNERNPILPTPIDKRYIDSLGRNAHVYKYKQAIQVLPFLQVVLDHIREPEALFFRNFGVAVTRQVGYPPFLVYIKQVEGLGLSGLGAGFCQSLVVAQHVNKAALAHVAAAYEGKLRHWGGWHLVGAFPASFECGFFNVHRVLVWLSLRRNCAIFAVLLSTLVKPNPASGASKKQQVEEMFDNISHKYDFLNHFLSLGIDRGWRRKVRKAIAPNNPKIILDVATGTGDLAIELAKLGDVKITGVDISNGMLDRGRIKINRPELREKIVLQQADSENLPFSDNTFDAVSVAFGVRNFENLELGMREMQRVLKTGGQLAVLEFSKPRNKIIGALYWFYFRNILPMVGRMFSKSNNAYTYLPESVSRFPEGEAFVNIALACGFRTVTMKKLTFGISTLYVCAK